MSLRWAETHSRFSGTSEQRNLTAFRDGVHSGSCSLKFLGDRRSVLQSSDTETQEGDSVTVRRVIRDRNSSRCPVAL